MKSCPCLVIAGSKFSGWAPSTADNSVMSEAKASKSAVEPDNRPVWRRPWFQWAAGALVVMAVLAYVLPPVFKLLYATRTVLVPVLVGMTLAYVVNPLVTWVNVKWRVPRQISAGAILLGTGVLVLALTVFLGSTLVSQASKLIRNAPEYAQTIADHLDVDLQEVRERAENAVRHSLGAGAASDAEQAEQAITTAATEVTNATVVATQPTENMELSAATTQPTAADPSSTTGSLADIDLTALAQHAMAVLDVGYSVVASTIGFTTYLVVAVMVIAFCFFFFVWKFDALIHWFVPFIPASHREPVLDVIRKCDKSVSAFIRGRLIQVGSVATVLSAGWFITGGAGGYWLLLGLFGGALNLIPYAPVIVWPIAVGLTWLEAVSPGGPGFSWIHVLLWPSVVYLVAQTLDGWVVEPIVQGQATNLDPLTVLLVVLIGASLMGFLGMLIAIPAAACIKIIARDLVLPRLRDMASQV